MYEVGGEEKGYPSFILGWNVAALGIRHQAPALTGGVSSALIQGSGRKVAPTGMLQAWGHQA